MRIARRNPVHVAVRGFVGSFGKRPRRHDEVREICGRPAESISRGQAHLTFVSRNARDQAIDLSSDELFLCKGRPFLDDRIFDEGPVPDVSKLDGKFACVLLRPDGIELLTDWLGAGAIYYASQDGALYFGSHLGLLLSILPEVPPMYDLGVASQLFSREQVFDETHFSKTYRLPAGCRLTATAVADKTIDVQMIRGRGIRGLLDMKVPAYSADYLRERLDKGVEREQYGENSVLMLSGGRDSMAIGVARAPTPERAVTYGERYSMDYVRGKCRARGLGLAFLPVPYQSWTLETYRDEITALQAGCCGLQAAHNLVGFDWASDKADLAAIGFMGDVCRAGYIEKLGVEPNERTVLPNLLKRCNDPILKRYYARERQVIIDYVTDTYRDLERDVGDYRAWAILKLQWMQARWLSAEFDLCDWHLSASYPFVQRELAASWLQTDIENPQTRRIFDRVLRQALGERGLPRDVRGNISQRVWNRSLTTLLSRIKGRDMLGRCDWRSVIDRSRAPFESPTCQNDRLAEVMRASWQSVKSGANPHPIASAAYVSAALVAARAAFSSVGTAPAR